MLRGIALKIGATFVFALMAAIIKAVAARYPVGEVVLFRSLFALVVLVAWLASRGEFPAALHTRRPLGHIGRSLIGTGGMFANFVALALLPLAAATAFTFATPLIVVVLAALLALETVRIYRWAAVAVGFVGVIVMLSEQLGDGVGDLAAPSLATIGATVALAGAVASAGAMIQTRRLTKSEATGAIVFYFSLLTGVFSAVVLVVAALWPAGAPGAVFVAAQRFAPPSGIDLLLLAAVGLLGGAGQIMMTHSYRFADASVIAAFDYTSMLWALALGVALFDETPSARMLSGAAIVIASGGFVLWREHRLRALRLRPRTPDSAPKLEKPLVSSVR
jgi:drug/metabolite transporter (DMT)-like permease